MADRVYPSAKPAVNGVTPTTNGVTATTNPTFPATKSQLYGANRPPYRPNPHRRRDHRRWCSKCCCFLWTLITILTVILLAAVAAIALYVIYNPHRPSFTVAGIKIATLNLTSTHLVTNINLNVTAKNPNKNLIFFYNPTAVTLLTNGGIVIGDGEFPGFVHGKKNTTFLKTVITQNRELEDEPASTLKSELKAKNGVPIKIMLDTKVKAKLGKLKTPKIGIRVSCEGVKITVPSGKKVTIGSTSNAMCKVDVRIKIWRWTF